MFSVLPGSGRQAAAGLALAGLAAAPVALFSVSAPFASPAAAQQAKGKQEILLVGYAVTKAAYDRIIPLFEADWKKKTGQTVDVKTSFGGWASINKKFFGPKGLWDQIFARSR